MPAYRRRARRPRRAPRRRPARRGRRVGRLGSPRNVYSYKRTLFLQSNIQVGAVNDYSNHFGFTLGMLPNASDFTNLYDEYRVNKVVIKFIPKFSATLQGTGIANYMNQVHTALDYDDSLALPTATAIQEITQYQSHRMTMGARMVTRTVTPKVELTGSSVQAPKAYQWLDCDNTASLHNGVKLVIPKCDNATSLLVYDTQMTVYLSFRNVL